MYYLKGKGLYGVCKFLKVGVGILSSGNFLGDRFKIFSCDCIICVEMFGLLFSRRMWK